MTGRSALTLDMKVQVHLPPCTVAFVIGRLSAMHDLNITIHPTIIATHQKLIQLLLQNQNKTTIKLQRGTAIAELILVPSANSGTMPVPHFSSAAGLLYPSCPPTAAPPYHDTASDANTVLKSVMDQATQTTGTLTRIRHMFRRK